MWDKAWLYMSDRIIKKERKKERNFYHTTDVNFVYFQDSSLKYGMNYGFI